MFQKVKATYRDGSFVPETPCDLPDGSAVDLIVQGPLIQPPEVTEPEQRQRIIDAMLDRMEGNPIPADAPPLTRESLHERR